MDIAFIPKFISKEKTQNFLDSLTNTFKNAIIEDRKLRMDVGIILGGMILKHIKNKEKRDKLLGRINMKQIKTDLENLVYDEFGEELDAKDKEIEELKNSNKELKSKVKELNELKDFNSPKAKQIIQSMMLL